MPCYYHQCELICYKRTDLLLERGFKKRQRVAQDSKHTLEEVNRVLDRFRLTREAFSCTPMLTWLLLLLHLHVRERVCACVRAVCVQHLRTAGCVACEKLHWWIDIVIRGMQSSASTARRARSRCRRTRRGP